jgi:hypothetical protein
MLIHSYASFLTFDKRKLLEVRQNGGSPSFGRTCSCSYFFIRLTTFRRALSAAFPGFDFLIWLLASSIWPRNRF